MEAKSNILKKEDLFCLLHPATLPGFQPLKEETNTRLILKGRLGNSKEPLVIKIFKRPHFFDQIKYFFRPPRSRKEWQIGQKLSHLDIPTPSLVAYIALRRGCFLAQDLIVFRELTDVEPLINWIEINFIQKPLPFFERQEVIRALGRFVRRVHDQGIFSNDFHQGNILIKTEPGTTPLFYLIDFHAIRIKKEITRRERIKMLAQFNNFRIPIADRLRFLKAYLQGGGQEEISKEALVKEIGLASFRHWQRLWQKRKKRSLRPGKGLEMFAMGAWKGMIRKEYNLKNFFPLLDKLGANTKGAGGVVKEVFLQENAKNLAIRYYNQTGFFSTLRSFFHISPAKKTWVTMHNLIMRGITTLVPVAFGERKRWGILRDGFFAFEKIPETTSGAIFLKELSETPLNVQDPSLKKRIIFHLARLIRWMHQTGMCHRTLKSSDIRVAFDHKKVLLHLVDVSGMMIKKNVGVNDVAKDLNAIRLSFLYALEQKDQNFFFKIYAWGNTFFKNNDKTIRDKMQKLCQFLYKDIPPIAFLCENNGLDKARKRKRKKIRTVIKRSFVVLAGLLLLLGIILSWVRFGFIKKNVWSLSIYTGSDPYAFSPHPLVKKHPVLQASDVVDVPAFFLSDPFMVQHNNTWFMFFEVFNKSSQQGDVGLAISYDGIVWHYEKIVLDEPFHLSYPCVFKWKDCFYMVPESRGAHSVRLYQATEFPYHWTFVAELVTGDYADPSLIFKDGRWWLFVLMKPGDKLALYYASDLQGPWTEHPASPLITGDKKISRPGGRLTMFREKIIRYAQMGVPTYGSGLRAFQIDELTTTAYREHELPQSPILSGSGKGWNATGMHHIDPHQIKTNEWIACVDGKTRVKVFDGKIRIDRMVQQVKKLIK